MAVTLVAALRTMIERAEPRGYVTYCELNAALPPDQVSSEDIEDVLVILSTLGINPDFSPVPQRRALRAVAVVMKAAGLRV
jgi:Sigma-70 factor, region 1.1